MEITMVAMDGWKIWHRSKPKSITFFYQITFTELKSVEWNRKYRASKLYHSFLDTLYFPRNCVYTVEGREKPHKRYTAVMSSHTHGLWKPPCLVERYARHHPQYPVRALHWVQLLTTNVTLESRVVRLPFLSAWCCPSPETARTVISDIGVVV